MNVFSNLQKNIDHCKNKIASEDIVYYNFEINGKKACAVYVDSITDKNNLGELLIKPLLSQGINTAKDAISSTALANVESETSLEKALGELLKGKTLIFFDKDTTALIYDLFSFQARSVTEPPTSTVVKGPREGFVECIKTNISMLRRRLKVNDFTIENTEIGRYSKTTVAICYLETIADKALVEKVKSRLKLIDIDAIPDSSYIGKMIVEHKTSLFKQVGNTEKPDVFTQRILEGRVGILVDGSPIAITVPYLLVEDFQSPEDYFVNNYRANMQRTLRVISLAIAIYLPAIFVSAQLFHLHIIPLNFLLTIVNSIKGIPLSPGFEMFFTLLIFEILNEASVRMPKYVGMALSIVGALVLGDTAVKAGIVSTPTIMIMALSGICLYTAPELVDSMSVLRLSFLIVAGTFGSYGITLLSAFLLIYLCSLENFEVPVLAPIAPLVPEDNKDALYMDFISDMRLRPLSVKNNNRVRMNIKDVRK